MGKVLADYHMHSISPDARVPMADLCAAAIERGITEIAITDHFEFYTPDYRSKEALLFGESYLDRYFEEYARCAPAFEGKVAMRRGMECGQPLVNPDFSSRVMDKYAFDYVIGSIHKLYNVDLSFKRYSANTNDSIAKANLEMLFELADRADFDCMGHIDLIKRYATRQNETVSLMSYPAEVTDILKRLIARGKGLEINTSGLRQGLGETLPGLDILKLYRTLGGEILTAGSDAHRACDVAADLDVARMLALEAGFTKLATYRDRVCAFYSIE